MSEEGVASPDSPVRPERESPEVRVRKALRLRNRNRLAEYENARALLSADEQNILDELVNVSEAGERTPVGPEQESEGRELAKERRKAAVEDLIRGYGSGIRVEAKRPWLYWRGSDNEARAIRGDGSVATLHLGDAHNFGGRDTPVWRVWRGGDTWEDNASPADIQRAYDAARGGAGSRVEAPRASDTREAPEGGALPEAEPESEERPKRENEDESLDPTKFSIRVRALVHKDRPSDNTTYYTHPDAPGREFTKEEMGAYKAAWNSDAEGHEKGKPKSGRRLRVTARGIPKTPERIARTTKSPASEEPLPRGASIAGRIFENKKSSDAIRNWEVNPADYIGIQPMSIPAILSNPAYQQLYGELLNRLAPDKPDLFERLYSGNLEKEDEKIIEYSQWELAKGLDRNEKVASRLKQSDVELMMKRDPALRRAATRIGVPRMTELLREELPHLAMQDPTAMKELIETYEALADDRRSIRYKLWDRKVRTFLKKYDIEEHDFYKLDTQEGRKAMQKDLAKRYKDDAGTFIRTLDWAATKVWRESSFDQRARQAMEHAQRIQAPATPISSRWIPDFITRIIPRGPTARMLQGNIDPKLAVITRVLARTVSDDAMQRKINIEAILGDKLQPARQWGPDSYADFKERKAKISALNWQTLFNRDKAARIATYGPQTEAQLRDFRDNEWNPAEAQEFAQDARGLGFWASIFRAFFGPFIRDKKRRVALA